jgi:hypothetical protein
VVSLCVITVSSLHCGLPRIDTNFNIVSVLGVGAGAAAAMYFRSKKSGGGDVGPGGAALPDDEELSTWRVFRNDVLAARRHMSSLGKEVMPASPSTNGFSRSTTFGAGSQVDLAAMAASNLQKSVTSLCAADMEDDLDAHLAPGVVAAPPRLAAPPLAPPRRGAKPTQLQQIVTSTPPPPPPPPPL